MFNLRDFDAGNLGGFSPEERRWHGPSSTMDHFHNMFKVEFNEIYALADGSFEKLVEVAQQLVIHLNTHHTIEEAHIFPILAEKMPAFADDEVHKTSHEKIHQGVDQLTALLSKWSKDPSTYSAQELRVSLDSWREVLFSHLDDEVRDLSAENLKKYWTLQELENFPL